MVCVNICYKEDGVKLFSRETSGRTGGNKFQYNTANFSKHERKLFYCERILKQVAQRHSYTLLGEEDLGREKLEGVTEYMLSFRLSEQCISPFQIKNLIFLTSKSSLLQLLEGLKLLSSSEQVRSS